MSSEEPKVDANVSAGGRPRLTGWELIEDHFVRHDTNIVEGFNKDIDTLLVFAGLFSAVLSAFVIVSLSNLQPDNGQTSVTLLLHLSAQTANSSQPAATLPDFHVPNSAVWINSLWFLSLILSLTSALFGMIAKQWLREYMEWSTTSWLPRRFIVLRQQRFEAFNEWRVPAIIAAIPALLEVALILFFTGLIVFLWTFNVVVAGVSIAVIAISIALAVLATVLPVFYRQCPYKSPTGWACLRMVWLSTGAWETLREKIRKQLSEGSRCHRLAERLQISFNGCTSWRERDFGGGGEDVVGQAVVDALGCKEVRFEDSASYIEHTITDADRRVKPLGDLAALRRAFTWIYDTSQNEYLLLAVEQCAATRVTDGCPPLALLAFDFAVACQALNMDPKKMLEHLDKLYDIALVDNSRVEYASLRNDWIDQFDLVEQLNALQDTRPQLVHQLAQTLVRDLSQFLDRTDLRAAYFSEASARFLMRIMALCAQLALLVDCSQWTFLGRLSPHFHKLCKMHRSLPGLASTLFELLSLDLVSLTPEHLPDAGFVKLALSLSEDILSTWSRDKCELFCRVSGRAPFCMDEDSPNGNIGELFACMDKVVHRALEFGWQNCGAYTGLDILWLQPLHNFFHRALYNNSAMSQQMRAVFPHVLIARLVLYRHARLLTGDMTALKQLMAVSQRLRDADDTAKPASVHGTGTSDIQHVRPTPLAANPANPLSTPRPTFPTPPSLSDESSAHTEGRAASITWMSTSPSFHGSLPDVTATVPDIPISSYDDPPPPTSLRSPHLGEISTPAAIVIRQGPADQTFALRDPQSHRTRDTVIADTAQDDIELHDLGPWQTIQTQSQGLLVEDEREHIDHAALTFSTDDADTLSLLRESIESLINGHDTKQDCQPHTTVDLPLAGSLPARHRQLSCSESATTPRDDSDRSMNTRPPFLIDDQPSQASVSCANHDLTLATDTDSLTRFADSLFTSAHDDKPQLLSSDSSLRPTD